MVCFHESVLPDWHKFSVSFLFLFLTTLELFCILIDKDHNLVPNVVFNWDLYLHKASMLLLILKQTNEHIQGFARFCVSQF